MSQVPNQFPTTPPDAIRLAVVGESPGLEEENWAVCPSGHGYSRRKWSLGSLVDVTRCPMCSTADFVSRPTPFVGPSGFLLNDCLKRAGIRREQVFVGNVCRYHLAESEFVNATKVAPELDALSADLAEFRSNCVLLLGNQALRAFHPWHWQTETAFEREKVDPRQLSLFTERDIPRRPRKVSSGTKFTCKISDWRGSIFDSDQITPGGPHWKCVAAYHPAAVLRQREWMPILRQDIKRSVYEAECPDLDPPLVALLMPGESKLEGVIA